MAGRMMSPLILHDGCIDVITVNRIEVADVIIAALGDDMKANDFQPDQVEELFKACRSWGRRFKEFHPNVAADREEEKGKWGF